MANEINDLKGILFLVFLAVQMIASANVNCEGKAFHCVNSTHFMICVDLGGGVSTTIDDFIIPCPATTVCHKNNIFECEFPKIEDPPPLQVIGVNEQSDTNEKTLVIDSVTISTTLSEKLDIFKENITVTTNPIPDEVTFVPKLEVLEDIKQSTKANSESSTKESIQVSSTSTDVVDKQNDTVTTFTIDNNRFDSAVATSTDKTKFESIDKATSIIGIIDLTSTNPQNATTIKSDSLSPNNETNVTQIKYDIQNISNKSTTHNENVQNESENERESHYNNLKTNEYNNEISTGYFFQQNNDTISVIEKVPEIVTNYSAFNDINFTSGTVTLDISSQTTTETYDFTTSADFIITDSHSTGSTISLIDEIMSFDNNAVLHDNTATINTVNQYVTEQIVRQDENKENITYEVAAENSLTERSIISNELVTNNATTIKSDSLSPNNETNVTQIKYDAQNISNTSTTHNENVQNETFIVTEEVGTTSVPEFNLYNESNYNNLKTNEYNNEISTDQYFFQQNNDTSSVIEKVPEIVTNYSAFNDINFTSETVTLDIRSQTTTETYDSTTSADFIITDSHSTGSTISLIDEITSLDNNAVLHDNTATIITVDQYVTEQIVRQDENKENITYEVAKESSLTERSIISNELVTNNNESFIGSYGNNSTEYKIDNSSVNETVVSQNSFIEITTAKSVTTRYLTPDKINLTSESVDYFITTDPNIEYLGLNDLFYNDSQTVTEENSSDTVLTSFTTPNAATVDEYNDEKNKILTDGISTTPTINTYSESFSMDDSNSNSRYITEHETVVVITTTKSKPVTNTVSNDEVSMYVENIQSSTETIYSLTTGQNIKYTTDLTTASQGILDDDTVSEPTTIIQPLNIIVTTGVPIELNVSLTATNNNTVEKAELVYNMSSTVLPSDQVAVSTLVPPLTLKYPTLEELTTQILQTELPTHNTEAITEVSVTTNGDSIDQMVTTDKFSEVYPTSATLISIENEPVDDGLTLQPDNNVMIAPTEKTLEIVTQNDPSSTDYRPTEKAVTDKKNKNQDINYHSANIDTVVLHENFNTAQWSKKIKNESNVLTSFRKDQENSITTPYSPDVSETTSVSDDANSIAEDYNIAANDTMTNATTMSIGMVESSTTPVSIDTFKILEEVTNTLPDINIRSTTAYNSETTTAYLLDNSHNTYIVKDINITSISPQSSQLNNYNTTNSIADIATTTVNFVPSVVQTVENLKNTPSSKYKVDGEDMLSNNNRNKTFSETQSINKIHNNTTDNTSSTSSAAYKNKDEHIKIVSKLGIANSSVNAILNGTLQPNDTTSAISYDYNETKPSDSSVSSTTNDNPDNIVQSATNIFKKYTMNKFLPGNDTIISVLTAKSTQFNLTETVNVTEQPKHLINVRPPLASLKAYSLNDGVDVEATFPSVSTNIIVNKSQATNKIYNNTINNTPSTSSMDYENKNESIKMVSKLDIANFPVSAILKGTLHTTDSSSATSYDYNKTNKDSIVSFTINPNSTYIEESENSLHSLPDNDTINSDSATKSANAYPTKVVNAIKQSAYVINTRPAVLILNASSLKGGVDAKAVLPNFGTDNIIQFISKMYGNASDSTPPTLLSAYSNMNDSTKINSEFDINNSSINMALKTSDSNHSLSYDYNEIIKPQHSTNYTSFTKEAGETAKKTIKEYPRRTNTNDSLLNKNEMDLVLTTNDAQFNTTEKVTSGDLGQVKNVTETRAPMSSIIERLNTTEPDIVTENPHANTFSKYAIITELNKMPLEVATTLVRGLIDKTPETPEVINNTSQVYGESITMKTTAYTLSSTLITQVVKDKIISEKSSSPTTKEMETQTMKLKNTEQEHSILKGPIVQMTIKPDLTTTFSQTMLPSVIKTYNILPEIKTKYFPENAMSTTTTGNSDISQSSTEIINNSVTESDVMVETINIKTVETYLRDTILNEITLNNITVDHSNNSFKSVKKKVDHEKIKIATTTKNINQIKTVHNNNSSAETVNYTENDVINIDINIDNVKMEETSTEEQSTTVMDPQNENLPDNLPLLTRNVRKGSKTIYTSTYKPSGVIKNPYQVGVIQSEPDQYFTQLRVAMNNKNKRSDGSLNINIGISDEKQDQVRVDTGNMTDRYNTNNTKVNITSSYRDLSLHNSTSNDDIHLISLNHTITTTIQSYVNESEKQSNKTTGELKLNGNDMNNPNLTSTNIQLNDGGKDKRVTNVSVSLFDCSNHTRGKYADKKDCRKFYICIGKLQPIIGTCPNNTVFSEINKQCTKNLSHCVRNNQFRCLFEGRFSDFFKDNIYYICVKNTLNTFIRYKLQCQDGYYLNKESVKCEKNTEVSAQSLSSVSENSKISNDESTSEIKLNDSGKNVNNSDFECEKEGKFPHEKDCRKYYVCSKNKNDYRRRIKKCANDEVYDSKKKKCIKAESSEC